MAGKKPDAAASPLVGVIASPAALGKAISLRNPPDFFELRLDTLYRSLGQIDRAIPKLRAPLIVTARHPKEGGLNALRAGTRRELLLRYLASATFIDLELRSVRQMDPVLKKMRRRKIRLIISCHELHDTPRLSELNRKAHEGATSGADLFKIATRTDTPAQLARLISFYEASRTLLPIAAMGIGQLGAESRRRLAQLGTALIYASLDAASVEGQPSLRNLLRARRAYIK